MKPSISSLIFFFHHHIAAKTPSSSSKAISSSITINNLIHNHYPTKTYFVALLFSPPIINKSSSPNKHHISHKIPTLFSLIDSSITSESKSPKSGPNHPLKLKKKYSPTVPSSNSSSLANIYQTKLSILDSLKDSSSSLFIKRNNSIKTSKIYNKMTPLSAPTMSSTPTWP